MEYSPTTYLVLNIFLGFTALLTLSVTLLVLTAPSQYETYRRDLVEHHDMHAPSEAKTDAERRAWFEQDEQKLLKLRHDASVHIVVLGDIGRSPRMQYHAISFARSAARVHLIGYYESDLHPALLNDDSVTIVPLPLPPRILRIRSMLFFPFIAPLKALYQAYTLYYTLGYKISPAKWMLVQNPPSIPLLLVAILICFFRNTRLVIDWHNFGWSVLALQLGQAHLLVIIARLYERICARGAEFNFAVTNAMVKRLANDFHVQAFALHDRPADIFKPLDSIDRLLFLQRHDLTSPFAQDIQHHKWRLLVSSTSWTADEDFSLLLNALVRYSEHAVNHATLPELLVVITGKGPQKAHYQASMDKLKQTGKLSHVLIKTAWLSMTDYAALLGAADLGISLHRSTSGVDLPMKVVDMFGAALPVVGWAGFEAWPELVKEGVNGRGFTTADELAAILERLFSGNGEELHTLRKGAREECNVRWDDVWTPKAGRVFGLVKNKPIKAI